MLLLAMSLVEVAFEVTSERERERERACVRVTVSESVC